MATSLMEMVQEARSTIREISAERAAEELRPANDVMLIDVREPAEFAKAHIRGAVNVPRGMLELRADSASPIADPGLVARREATVLVYCLKAPGARSVLATETLARMGYTHVAAIQGGLVSWQDQGLPVETTDRQ